MNTDILTITYSDCVQIAEKNITPYHSDHWPDAHVWVAREQAEHDERYLQVIPYALLVNGDNKIWCYQRIGGDERILHRSSCGVGGHVDRCDASDNTFRTDDALSSAAICRNGLLRELREELENIQDVNPSRLHPVAWIHERDSAIGRVHIGLVYVYSWNNDDDPQPRQGESLQSLGWRDAPTILADDNFEHWSHLAITALHSSDASNAMKDSEGLS